MGLDIKYFYFTNPEMKGGKNNKKQILIIKIIRRFKMLKKSIGSLTLLLLLCVSLALATDISSDLAPGANKEMKEYFPPPPSSTDTILWETKAPSPDPGRYWCPAVGVVRDTIYIFAGRGGATANSINLVYGYDVVTNTWVTSLPNTLIERRAGAGGQVGNKVYLCGGRNTAHTTLNTCEEYDLDTKTSTYKANMPSARWSCAGAAIDDKVYVFGSESYSDQLLEFNATTNTWRTITPTPRPSGRGWTAVAAAGGKLYVLGGSISGGAAVGDCWEFDPGTETWTQKANMPGLRMYHTAVGFGDDNIYVIGGASSGSGSGDNLVYKYTISTNTWETESPITTPRGWEMLAVNNGVLYVMCGSNCTTPTYLTVNEAGEIEAPREHDVGIRSIVSPAGRIPSGDPVDVEAMIKNFGANEETFSAYATIWTQADDTVFMAETSLTIPARTEQSVMFGQFTPDPDQIFEVLFYTFLPGDENPANDTMMGEASTRPDAGVLRIISPTGRIIPATLTDAEAMVMNYSAEPKDVPATLMIVDTVTGNTILDVDTTIAIGAADSLAIVFGQFTSVIGSYYEVVAYTSLAGDDDPTNDTAYANAVCRFGSAPDPFGYYYESTQEPGDTVTYSWIDPSGGTTLTGWSPSADDGIVTRTLPFGINFYRGGAPNITQINVCTNGFLETTTATTYTNAEFPVSSIQNMIAPFWDDLTLTTQGSVIEKTGTDGAYVAYSWVGVPQYTGGALQTFQVVLYRNNHIRFNYMDVNGTLNSNTIGIQGGTGANGWYQQYVFDGDPANHIIADNVTIAFTCDSLIGIAEAPRDNAPTTTILHTAKPNPVLKGSAEISFSLAKKGDISISIFDATGRMIRNLVNAPYEAGSYNVTWDGRNDRGNDVMSGIYFYTIETDNYKSTRKLVFMR